MEGTAWAWRCAIPRARVAKAAAWIAGESARTLPLCTTSWSEPSGARATTTKRRGGSVRQPSTRPEGGRGGRRRARGRSRSGRRRAPRRRRRRRPRPLRYEAAWRQLSRHASWPRRRRQSRRCRGRRRARRRPWRPRRRCAATSSFASGGWRIRSSSAQRRHHLLRLLESERRVELGQGRLRHTRRRRRSRRAPASASVRARFSTNISARSA